MKIKNERPDKNENMKTPTHEKYRLGTSLRSKMKILLLKFATCIDRRGILLAFQ